MKVLQILVLIIGLSAFSFAQKAILSGNVTDVWGAVIPNAKINAKNVKGEIFSTRTNINGFYELKLEAGAYNIEVILSPFDEFSVSDYWIVNKMRLDVALQCKKCEIIDQDLLKSEPKEKLEASETKTSDKILQKPLEQSPKAQNKTKRKNKNNKQ